jgi:glutamate-1-semialdehyde 2,1-aminomutase
MSLQASATSRNDYLVSRARRYIAGGVLALLELPADDQFVVARGQGSRVWDVEGREYIDYMMGAGPQLLGHGHPAVIGAVSRQLERGTQFYALNEPAIELAAELVSAVPCGDLVRFVGTGNEATFMALRLARAFTGRELVLRFEGGYHGTHDYALMGYKPTTQLPFPESSPDSAGIPRAMRELVLNAPFNDQEIVTSIIQEYGANLAAVIVEPLFRGVPPKPGFLEALRQATSEHGIVLIFDEIVTGFRIAWGGGQELYGVTPDLATYGKTIGGGFPIAAIVGKTQLMELLASPSKTSRQQVISGGTFSGNPISTTAGLAALRELHKDGVYDRLWALGKRLGDGLRSLLNERGEPGVVYHTGPVVNLFFTDHEEVTDYRTARAADSRKAQRFASELLARGVFVNPSSSWFLSLAHTETDIDETLERCDDALQAVATSAHK